MNAENYKYFAFISYSHADAKWASWLHRSLEKFTIPPSLRKAATDPLPKSLYPIFKDREELPTASALGENITRALIASHYLIVICSPHAAHSDWVNEEVCIFKSLGRGDRVLCLIVDGEPSVSDNFSHRPENHIHPLRRASDRPDAIMRPSPPLTGRPHATDKTASQECFPPAVRYNIGPDKQILPEPANPIAADVRDGRDGKTLALSKLIAGLLNVDVFQLTQRQNQRRVNRLRVIAVLMLVLVTAFASIAIKAWMAQKKAEELSLIALSRQLSTHANALFDSDKSLRVSMLLAGAQAHGFAPTIEARGATLKTLLATRAIKTLLSADAAVLKIAYSAQGNLLAAATEQGNILIWDLETMTQRFPPLTGHDGNVVAVAFSPDSTRLISGGVDETVKVWDLASATTSTPPTFTSLNAHSDWVVGADFSPDGNTFVTAGWDGRVILWDSARLKPLTELPLRNRGWASSINVSPNGRWLAVGRENGAVEIWDMTTRMLSEDIPENHAGWVTDVSFSHNNQYLASTSSDGTISLWDLHSQTSRYVISSGSGVTSVAFSHDDSLLITGGWDRKVTMWDLVSGKVHRPPLIGHTEQVAGVAVAPDGKSFASAGHDGAIVIWQPRDAYPFTRHHCSQRSPVNSIAYHPGGTRMAISSLNNQVRLCTVGNDAAPQRLADSTSKSLTFSRDGQRLALISNEHEVLQIDVQSLVPVADAIDLSPNVITSLAYSPDNQLIAIGDRSANVHLWQLAPTRPIRTLTGHQGPILDLAFSDDGQILATASEDAQILLWNLSEEVPPTPTALGGSVTPVTAIAFQPASRHILASGSEDGVLTFWNTATHLPVGVPITAHDGAINALSFSMDGTLIATGGSDGIISLRDSRSHRQIGPKLTAQTDQVTALSFSPTTYTLASGNADGTIYLWDLDIEHWKATICNKVVQQLTHREWELYVGTGVPYQNACQRTTPAT